MKKFLTEEEKNYIADNAGKMTAYQISVHLKRPYGSIRVYMCNNGLTSSGPLNESLSPENMKFLMDSLEVMPMTKIAKKLGVSYSRLYGFCALRGLIKKRERLCLPPIPMEPKKEPIKRPPAVYSNPNYQNMYL